MSDATTGTTSSPIVGRDDEVAEERALIDSVDRLHALGDQCVGHNRARDVWPPDD